MSVGSVENRDNPVGRDFREPGQPVRRDYREPEQSSRAIFWRTGTFDSNDIFEIRDNPV